MQQEPVVLLPCHPLRNPRLGVQTHVLVFPQRQHYSRRQAPLPDIPEELQLFRLVEMVPSWECQCLATFLFSMHAQDAYPSTPNSSSGAISLLCLLPYMTTTLRDPCLTRAILTLQLQATDQSFQTINVNSDISKQSQHELSLE
jgi:hypothetical protein